MKNCTFDKLKSLALKMSFIFLNHLSHINQKACLTPRMSRSHAVLCLILLGLSPLDHCLEMFTLKDLRPVYLLLIFNRVRGTDWWNGHLKLPTYVETALNFLFVVVFTRKIVKYIKKVVECEGQTDFSAVTKSLIP